MTLTEKRLVELDEKLTAYPLSLIQDFITFQIHCARTGINADEISSYIRHLVGDIRRVTARKSEEARRVLQEKAPRCTVCNNILLLEDINDRKSRMVDKHSKSWWVCPNPRCDFEPIMSDKYPYEVLSGLGIQMHEKPKPTLSSKKRRRAATQQGGRGKRR